TLIGLLVASNGATLKPLGLKIAAGSVAYLVFFVLVLHPIFRPAHGSMETHFAKWGSDVPSMLANWIRSPRVLIEHLLAKHRIFYLPKILLPLGLVPLLRPRWLVLASPIVAVNLLSSFEKITNLDEHYLTPAVPSLVASFLEGAFVVRRWTSPRIFTLTCLV